MAYLKWLDTYDIGFKIIDEQHKKLIDIINELYEAQRHGTSQIAIIDTLDKLADYTVYHFATEEKLFAQYEYPKTTEHLAEHKSFVDQVVKFQQELKMGSLLLSLKTMEYLKDWTITHILGSDREFGEFVQLRELGE
jgi:hemerythrin-like metal-binding protein